MISTLGDLLRKRPALAALPATALLLGLWLLWGWWNSPGRAATAFMAAVERQDTSAMVAMADPSEVKYLGLTPKNVRVLLDDAARSPSGLRFLNTDKIDDRHGRVLYGAILADGLGHALPNVRPHKPGMEGPIANTVVSVYRSGGRWRVNLSSFIGMVARFRYPDNFRTLFVHHGLPDAYLDDADSYWMSWEGRKVDPETLRPSGGGGPGGD